MWVTQYGHQRLSDKVPLVTFWVQNPNSNQISKDQCYAHFLCTIILVNYFKLKSTCFQYATSYPFKDYILAYIPIEELAYLSPEVRQLHYNIFQLLKKLITTQNARHTHNHEFST